MNYWLLKTEPNCYSFDDLVRDRQTHCDGVRNYQARNNLKSMKKSDLCFIYHSVGPREIVGTARVVKEYYPDPTTNDAAWVVVDVEPIKKLQNPISLAMIKNDPQLQHMQLIKQSRLSVCPVTTSEWEHLNH